MSRQVSEQQRTMKAIQRAAPGISVLQIILLQDIAQREGCRVNDLSKQLKKDPRDIGYQLHMLSNGKKGRPNTGLNLIRLKVSKDDGRARELFLTTKGRRLLQLLDSI